MERQRPGPRVVTAVRDAIDRDILRILAHDCLADLPPISFYEDAVVEHSGEHTSVFRLQRNVLQPLVDLGRVFGMAARTVMGTSTLDRFATARRLLPAHERIFREASDALRIVLWQQGRVGIGQGTHRRGAAAVGDEPQRSPHAPQHVPGDSASSSNSPPTRRGWMPSMSQSIDTL